MNSVSARFQTAKGVEIYYEISGKGNPLVFIHGVPVSSLCWQKQVAFFEKSYTVITLDLRGFGQSSRPQNIFRYHLPFLANDVLHLLQHLGYQTFNLVEHDLGGMISWYLGLYHPKVIERLIILY